MIVEFEVMMVGPGFYVVTAIMPDGPPVQVGIFDNVEDIDDACERFIELFDAERRQRLH